MVTEARVRSMMELLQQLLECRMVCFVPWCPDASLHHPLLDLWPERAFPTAFPAEEPGASLLKEILLDEQARACCDLAVQSGRMQVLNNHLLDLSGGRVQSLAAFPVERPAGMLGLLLLLDEQPAKFGAGEEQLLYRYLAQYAEFLEVTLREHWRVFMQDYLTHLGLVASGRGCTQTEPEQFVKGEFVSLVGHELRAPLSIIKGYVGLLQAYGGGEEEGQPERVLSPERRQYYLDRVMEQTNLLEVLVNDLLDLSHMQQGRLALHPTYVDVGLLCQHIVQFGQLWADQRASGTYQLVCKLVTPLVPIWTDVDRLRQVLMNLVENAIKYSPHGGVIEVEAGLVCERRRQNLIDDSTKDVTQVYIAVRDQGIGIAAQHFARLFQPFERLERPASSQIPGSGLGLYIAQKLVDSMGGRITVQSSEGKGTTITITLPISPSDERIVVGPVKQTSPPPSVKEEFSRSSMSSLRKKKHSDIV